jgi:hypothetical protein
MLRLLTLYVPCLLFFCKKIIDGSVTSLPKAVLPTQVRPGLYEPAIHDLCSGEQENCCRLLGELLT